jgi:uncharacterized DUF497 family protein
LTPLDERISACTGFQWDQGNRTKNASGHGMECAEAEEVFFNRPLFLLEDHAHSKQAERIHGFGMTHMHRPLAVTFTLRGKTIRIISARDQNRKEMRQYGFQRKR